MEWEVSRKCRCINVELYCGPQNCIVVSGVWTGGVPG